MPVTLTPAVDLTKVKLKWQETYVSEGLNRRTIPSQPGGIYRGLNLVANTSSPRQVEAAPDSNSVHMAVYETTDGFGLTWRDDAIGSMIFDLSDGSLTNTEVVLALLMDYQIGVDTTAAFTAYTKAEFDALPAATRDELVILGTVNVPGAGVNITESMILPDRRTLPWTNKSPGIVDWFPLIRNGDFELGVTGSSGDSKVTYWERFSTFIETETIDTDQNTGLRCLEFRSQSDFGLTGLFQQFMNVSCQPGQLIKLQYFKKTIVVPSGGEMAFELAFMDKDGVFVPSALIVETIDMSSVDSSFVKVDRVFKVPAGVQYLSCVGFAANNGLTIGDTVVFLRIDDLQVWLETAGPLAQKPVLRGSEVSASPLILPDRLSVVDSAGAARVEFTLNPGAGFPVGEGVVTIQRWDRQNDLLPPALQLFGRMVNVGDNLIDSIADALKARMSGTVRGGSGVLTLIQDWGPASVADGRIRMYVDGAGSFQITVNARWDGSLWNKDNGAVESSRMLMSAFVVSWATRIASGATWSEATWDNQVDIDLSSGQLRTDFEADLTDTADTLVNIGGLDQLRGKDYFMFAMFATTTTLNATRFLYPGCQYSTTSTTERKIRFQDENIVIKNITLRALTGPGTNGIFVFSLNRNGVRNSSTDIFLTSGSTSAGSGQINVSMSGTTNWDFSAQVITATNGIASPTQVIMKVRYTLV